MRTPRVAALPTPIPNEPPPCQQAEAIREHAAAMDRAVERFGPAADAIAGMAGRADALCRWLKGSKPWLLLCAYLVIERTVKMAPDDVPKLIGSLALLLKTMVGG